MNSETAMKNVLIADDDMLIGDLIELQLKDHGYDFNFYHVKNGMDALHIFTCLPFDLVILDHQMPMMSGLDVLKKMREIAPDIPILMTSGGCYGCEDLDCLPLGATGILAKPIHAKTLVETIEMVFFNAVTPANNRLLREISLNRLLRHDK